METRIEDTMNIEVVSLDELPSKTTRIRNSLKKYRLFRSLSRVADNTYSNKKVVAQRMMDVALLTANANQMQVLFKYQYVTKDVVDFWIPVVFIGCSIVLQVIVGVMLIFQTRQGDRNTDTVSGTSHRYSNRNRFNNCVVLLIFFVVVINIFVVAFSTHKVT